MEACCLQPIDTIKTRLQLDAAKKYSGTGSRLVAGHPAYVTDHLKLATRHLPEEIS